MGRRLESAERSDGIKISYTYNADGLRTSKTINNVKFNYFWNGDKLTAQTCGDNTWYFRYDGGTPIGFEYNGKEYYYVTNLQGDVIAILNSNGSWIAEYTYDAWGNCTVTRDTEYIAHLNPLRYRGYYYDSDTGLYYLQSRYYDANIGRFINSDEPIIMYDNQSSILENNLYSYCENNPVNYIDPNGYYKYDRKKARDYAWKWCFSHNPNYPNLESVGDCANFVSQCLHAGGIKMSYVSYRPWYCKKRKILGGWSFSHSWSYADNLYEFFRVNFAKAEFKIKTKKQLKKYASKVKIGDLAFLDVDCDGEMDHSTIITKVGSNLYYTSHSNSRHNKNINSVLDGETIVHILTMKDKY